jgi:hypothetical protein
MSDAAWVAVLDVLERDLDLLQREAAAGVVDGERPPVSVPTDLGPMPEPLRPRAAALHERMRVVEESLVDALERSRRDVAFSERRAPAPSQFLDTRW